MPPSSASETKILRQPLNINTNLAGIDLQFSTTWGLFSPRVIDEGTQLLISYLKIEPEFDCLDLGCGYGPLGITMAKLAPKGQTLLLDKDFVAVDYANINIKKNKINNASALLSNGMEQLNKQKFDLIVSNIPAKVGNEMLFLFFYDALHHLKPGGKLMVVTINGLRQFIKRSFNQVFGNFEKVKQGKNYTISSCTKIAN